MTKQEVAAAIIEAFRKVKPPPHWCVVARGEGPEPALVEKIFIGKLWNELSDNDLDRYPALLLFSAESFLYFLPAYLLRELDGHHFKNNDLTLLLTLGMTDEQRDKLVNPRRYGALTEWDNAIYRFSTLTKPQAKAIADFLAHKIEKPRKREPLEYPLIREALRNFWLPRSNMQVRASPDV
ncbi:DUF6714 family protein [Cupriavidus sp. DL-D2]|uniref:DUF6714 family protein n=1 Tax=Cupriavidus sp. DL-D2 TaxID=3144974 RepID=UPI003215EA60